MRGLADRYGWTLDAILELTPEAAAMFQGVDLHATTRKMSVEQYQATRQGARRMTRG